MQKKFIFFPLWNVDIIEKQLTTEEQNGNIVRKVNFNYWFSFSEKKNPNNESKYFLSYKSFRGESMGTTDYALSSSHSANEVKTDYCSYSLYRTKSDEEDLQFLRDCRADYIRVLLRTRIIAALFFFVILSGIFVLSLIYPEVRPLALPTGAFVLICLAVLTVGIYGYAVQNKKCKLIDKKLKNQK